MSIMVFCAPAVAGKRHLPMRRAFWYAGALPPRNHFGSVDMCGRGGTGRRAALRSLWEKSRGSSSLLDRTNTPSDEIHIRLIFQQKHIVIYFQSPEAVWGYLRASGGKQGFR